MAGFILKFLVLIAALFTLNVLEPVQRGFIQPFTSAIASLSTSLIANFDHDVSTFGRVISDPISGFAISIEAGCNGIEASIVLIAAVLAFPGKWLEKLTVITLGFLAIQIMNIGRIISLFYLGQFDRTIFEWAHLYLWPSLIMLDVLVVFLLYLRHLSSERAAHA